MRLLFQLDFLDGVVQTLQSQASTHDDLARSMASRSRSAQARGGSSWVGDQLNCARSLLGDNRQSLQSESADLRDRLTLARSTAEGWNGTQADLRAALAGIMAGSAGAVLGASTSAVRSAGASSANAPSQALLDAISRMNGVPEHDCFAYMSRVMQDPALNLTVPSVYWPDGWTGYEIVPTGQHWEPANPLTSMPPSGSFLELGPNFKELTKDGEVLNDLDYYPGTANGVHHSAIFLGTSGSKVYLAQANYGTAQRDGVGEVVTLPDDHKASLPSTWDKGDEGLKTLNEVLGLMTDGGGNHFGQAYFYQPASWAPAAIVPPPQPSLGPTPMSAPSATLKRS